MQGAPFADRGGTRTLAQTTTMKNLFEPAVRQEILGRLDSLTPASTAQWGKMDVAQMCGHCGAPFGIYFGDIKMRRPLIAYIFGASAKRKLFSEKPWPQNLPTAGRFKVTDSRLLDEERAKLAAEIRKFGQGPAMNPSPKHPFFGSMSADEWGIFAWRHLDHHLRQFGA
ncbi:MAG: hypothetical protein JWP27_1860 [Flaviaesturariibacter sp.]|nr:hypothetical protein [Flaviaesturariibacter sp.]